MEIVVMTSPFSICISGKRLQFTGGVSQIHTVLLQQTEGDCIKEWFWPLVCNQNVIKVLLK